MALLALFPLAALAQSNAPSGVATPQWPNTAMPQTGQIQGMPQIWQKPPQQPAQPVAGFAPDMKTGMNAIDATPPQGWQGYQQAGADPVWKAYSDQRIKEMEKLEELNDKRLQLAMRPLNHLSKQMDPLKSWTNLRVELTYVMYMQKFMQHTWTEVYGGWQFGEYDGYDRYRALMDLQLEYAAMAAGDVDQKTYEKHQDGNTIDSSHMRIFHAGPPLGDVVLTDDPLDPARKKVQGPMWAIYRYYHRFSYALARSEFTEEAGTCLNNVFIIWGTYAFGGGTSYMQFISNDGVKQRQCMQLANHYARGLVAFGKAWGTRQACHPERMALTVMLIRGMVCDYKYRQELGFNEYWRRRWAEINMAATQQRFPPYRNLILERERTVKASDRADKGVTTPLKLCYDLLRETTLDNDKEDMYKQTNSDALWTNCIVVFDSIIGDRDLLLSQVRHSLDRKARKNGDALSLDAAPREDVIRPVNFGPKEALYVAFDYYNDMMERGQSVEGAICNPVEYRELAHRFQWSAKLPMMDCQRNSGIEPPSSYHKVRMDVVFGHVAACKTMLKALEKAGPETKELKAFLQEEILVGAKKVRSMHTIEVSNPPMFKWINDHYLNIMALKVYVTQILTSGGVLPEIMFQRGTLATFTDLRGTMYTSEPEKFGWIEMIDNVLEQQVFKMLKRMYMETWQMDSGDVQSFLQYANAEIGSMAEEDKPMLQALYSLIVDSFHFIPKALDFMSIAETDFEPFSITDESSHQKSLDGQPDVMTPSIMMKFLEEQTCNIWILAQGVEATFQMRISPFAPLLVGMKLTADVVNAMGIKGIHGSDGFSTEMMDQDSMFPSEGPDLAMSQTIEEKKFKWEGNKVGVAVYDTRQSQTKITNADEAANTLGDELVFDSDYFEENKERTIRFKGWQSNRRARRYALWKQQEEEAAPCSHMGPRNDGFYLDNMMTLLQHNGLTVEFNETAMTTDVDPAFLFAEDSKYRRRSVMDPDPVQAWEAKQKANPQTKFAWAGSDEGKGPRSGGQGSGAGTGGVQDLERERTPPGRETKTDKVPGTRFMKNGVKSEADLERDNEEAAKKWAAHKNARAMWENAKLQQQRNQNAAARLKATSEGLRRFFDDGPLSKPSPVQTKLEQEDTASSFLEMEAKETQIHEHAKSKLEAMLEENFGAKKKESIAEKMARYGINVDSTTF